MTPGPDGALDARQGVGLPPDAQLGERILGSGTAIRSSVSSSMVTWGDDVTNDGDSDLTTCGPGWAAARVVA